MSFFGHKIGGIMKLLTYHYMGKDAVGFLSSDSKNVIPIKYLGLPYETMLDLIEKVTLDELRLLVKTKLIDFEGIRLDQIEKKSPIPQPRQDIICLGLNFMEHAQESARYQKKKFDDKRTYAVYFSKRVNEAVPDGGFIYAHQDIENRLDYEVEVAVIIGKDAKNVPEEEAFDYVFGYTIINDVSGRSLQMRHEQWYFGKSLDGFTPMGPWIVTADEFSKPPLMHLKSYVNGKLRQESSTNLFIFSIQHVIHELSQGMTLKAGTIISMGTPKGVGMGFDPPKFLKPGDLVVCEVEGIGQLSNTVK